MNFLLRLALVCVFSLLITEKVCAVDDAPIMVKPGKILFEDDFARPAMEPKWKVGLGTFTVQDGVVTGTENPADNHGAFAYVRPHFPYKDFVAEFSFKFDGGKSCSFRMDDTDYQGSHSGHIIRATIRPVAVTLDDSKFGSMKTDLYEKNKDPNTPPEEKERVRAQMKAKAAAYKVELDLAKWHQARVEVVGDEMLVSLDAKPVAYLKSEGVDHPTRNVIGFTIGGESVRLRQVKMWEATAAPDWPGHRAEILRAMQPSP